ncbi:single-stranded DNA-binding protein WHY2, mitochondrial isoform X2 [Tripterygium wilfordii]|uniref:single-stranded DNA-binding protein WHY2, mitochondrial isoform X2 n=1 Tax=Tripterygium wilfordii TaxID=458696 RepID=UPI0018F8127D|nr:single-stranded DNA-binding protein WHY2, mitochondrial isoform X2 [Tripterygium wilfordii]
MMKLQGLLQFRRAGDLKDALRLHTFTSLSCFSTASQNLSGHSTNRIFAPYYVYKGKAALSVQPVLPTFAKSQYGSLKMDRRGSVMLSFCPAIGERKYDREKRQVFALSATEVGSLISLGPKDSSEFFHDPSMKSSNAGQVRKSLSIKPQADGNGYLLSLSVTNNILKTNEKFIVPVTTAEFAVIKSACNFALPHIMGWDYLTKLSGDTGSNQLTMLPGDRGGNPSKMIPRHLESEWDR